MGTQVFIINPDGTTTELTTDGSIKNVLKTDECYVIVADDLRKVFLWKGINSNVRSKFIGAKRSQEIRAAFISNVARDKEAILLSDCCCGLFPTFLILIRDDNKIAVLLQLRGNGSSDPLC